VLGVLLSLFINYLSVVSFIECSFRAYSNNRDWVIGGLVVEKSGEGKEMMRRMRESFSLEFA
jgi:hypothetical protein